MLFYGKIKYRPISIKLEIQTQNVMLNKRLNSINPISLIVLEKIEIQISYQ